MKSGWSWFIITLTALNIIGCVWLLWRTSGKRADGKPADSTSHHWDGDLTEYNKPLPRWWINLFWLTIAFSIAYLAWYPGLGNLAGRKNWSSQAEHAAEQKAADQKLARAFAGYEQKPIDVIARDPKAVATGQ